MDEIETGNDQMVGITAGKIVIMFPKTMMTREEAMRHAAWLVALAEREDGEFEAILEAVESI